MIKVTLLIPTHFREMLLGKRLYCAVLLAFSSSILLHQISWDLIAHAITSSCMRVAMIILASKSQWKSLWRRIICVLPRLKIWYATIALREILIQFSVNKICHQTLRWSKVTLLFTQAASSISRTNLNAKRVLVFRRLLPSLDFLWDMKLPAIVFRWLACAKYAREKKTLSSWLGVTRTNVKTISM